MGDRKLSVVIAVKDGSENLPALLAALQSCVATPEVVLSCAGPAPATEDATTLSLPVDTLVPRLWSEGINRATGQAVALTTTQFVPDDRWLDRLNAVDLDRWAGVGGAIDNDPQASALNWAIFFLRYSAFAPPLPAGETDEIAADNAVYDREAILQHSDLLDEGFWEPSFHRRFRAAGRKIAIDPGMIVVHYGSVRGESFAHQRRLHGRAYGIERAERGSFARNVFLLLSSPLVPLLLLVRIVSRIAKKPAYRGKLLAAFPWLVQFTLAWAGGEAGGYASTMGRRLRGEAAHPSKRHF